MRRAGRSLLIAGLLLAMPGAAKAVEPDPAFGAYQAGHYRRALDLALKRIEANSSDAACCPANDVADSAAIVAFAGCPLGRIAAFLDRAKG